MKRGSSITPRPGACAACSVRPFALFRVIPQARAGEVVMDPVFTLYAG
jgi:hypothetical protein